MRCLYVFNKLSGGNKEIYYHEKIIFTLKELHDTSRTLILQTKRGVYRAGNKCLRSFKVLCTESFVLFDGIFVTKYIHTF